MHDKIIHLLFEWRDHYALYLWRESPAGRPDSVRQCVIRADASRIVLEEEVAVEDGVIIHTGGEDPVVTISRRVTIGHGAIIHARVIGPEASIGMGAVLSLCSEIGAGSIVAESALVPQGKIIPPETLVAGVPARPLRELTDKDRTDWRETKDWYVRMAAQYLDPDNYHPVK